MDIRKIKKLIEMLQESDLMEIEVKEGEESVRIMRGGQSLSGANQTLVSSGSNHTSLDSTPAPLEVPEESGSSIKSPIVGTFYRKPAPDKPPFVEIGDRVEAGDVVCIVEAMKMMNEIKSEFTGTVTAIKVEDGEPVEFDQQLIIVE
ncbi:MAG: acetyl-CoA carboxylase biotin carboxyl carrier protein subunit [SAR86 cluster bacterium BACL1 MAG-121105-bin34]|jgi:acetyl-CoA carboxylase biotin carboxyl carrier protein|uniref:Biotin carboxyl carrier protein of acetyl-CoA carboxylase n=2 Tax=SAR86 cluster TaxID=62672 RepID=A0A0R2U974_9GAMM|nr:MAG: acetyl-CoA carboxylase biotin carboxyl carrier protein subunit [SAR86 cluster bacterium BACL1 MAG-120507-bin14]KRO40725.1 MAG: acetyl-CoA carboxylase biotin carboxyl carrier protein subunit [SAR86 cluster bacterium BACL1 MAG-120920-bin57]KRO96057.1 MAG: acetyl-CoA carboxylase biotin carboxyl carrier protein subunit [SAR86 cluster bacterium BACL1 MAG-120820-bin45]KRO97375.1 MAG: acetyl-CoA carboxylase biotin carboxyl carrier protein subunit [SAR86 cluster bacterium BACL1 MAG-120828-bin5]